MIENLLVRKEDGSLINFDEREVKNTIKSYSIEPSMQEDLVQYVTKYSQNYAKRRKNYESGMLIIPSSTIASFIDQCARKIDKFGDYRNICRVCEREFGSMTGLASHIKITHPELTPQEYYDKFLKQEGEGYCKRCGKETRFISTMTGYLNFCSNKCSANTDSVIEKRIATNLERFGVEHAAQSKEVQEKTIQTNLDRYGVEYVLSHPDIIEKVRQTMIDRHGVTSYAKTPEFVEKVRKTSLEIYGTEHPTQAESVKEKFRETSLAIYGVDHPMKTEENREKLRDAMFNRVKTLSGEDYINVSALCREYGHGWYQSLDIPRINKSGVTLVSKEYIPQIIEYSDRDKAASSIERGVADFIESIYKGEIICNDRNIIYPKELDIYIPEKNLAIECNGMYWHSTNIGTPRNYHLMKTIECEEKGIRLIHITDWEWVNKKEILKSIIASSLGVYKERIYARKCEVKEIDSKTSKLFLEENHVQGPVNSSMRLGLFYKDELVQIVTAGKSRFKQGEVELHRMATKKNTQVIGGFSKLIKHLTERYNVNELMSFIDRSKFDGKGYKALGFEKISESPPNYHYYFRDTRLTRNQAQKHKLPKLLGENNFDESKTEIENMIDNGWLQVYDSGNIKVKYTRRENDRNSD